MSLNNRLVTEIIRQRLGSMDDTMAARVLITIPESLKAFGRKVAADPELRPLLVTPKASTSIAIGAGGALNLVTGYTNSQFLLEFFDQGQIYSLPAVTITATDATADTITWTANLAQFLELDRVQFSGSSLPFPLAAATNYYLVNYDPTTGISQLSTTANGLTLVNLTTAGSGTITMTKMDPTGQPMQRLTSPQQAALPNYLGGVFQYFFIQGSNLYVLPSTSAGSVAFAVSYYPTSLAGLPSSAEVEALYLDTLFEILTQAPKD